MELKPGAKPVYQRQFRLKPEDSKAVQDQLDDMLRNGLIEESTNHDWNSSLFTVGKRGTSEKRVVIDLR